MSEVPGMEERRPGQGARAISDVYVCTYIYNLYIYIYIYNICIYIYIYRMWIYFIIDHISEIPETQSSMLWGAGWNLIILPFEGLVETMACLGRLFCSFSGRAELPGFWLLTAGECFKQLCFFLLDENAVIVETHLPFVWKRFDIAWYCTLTYNNASPDSAALPLKW